MATKRAYSPEIAANQEALLDGQGRAMGESLERVSGRRVLRTTDYVSMPVEQPEWMKRSPVNEHPSLWGMAFYANAVTRALVANGLVRPRGGPRAVDQWRRGW